MKECDLSAPGLAIIAACPAAGKSALMVSMALDMSMHETPVAIFSLELSNMQIALRMLSNVCNMSWDNLRKKYLPILSWLRLSAERRSYEVCHCLLMTLPGFLLQNSVRKRDY
jgi:replicative DNA helicase